MLSLSTIFLHIVERGVVVMNRTKRFLRDGLILALSSIFMRTVGVMWNAYVSNKVGAESMGLLSLAMSVYGFAVTFACSGVSLGVTRTVSEALGREDKAGAVRSLRTSILYSALFGTVCSISLYFGSDIIAAKLLGDERCAVCIRIMSVSMLPISLSSVFSGYFNAVRRVYKSAVSSVFEQFIRMGCCVVLFSLFLPKGTVGGCIAIILGGAVAECVSSLCSGVLCLFDSGLHLKSTKRTRTFPTLVSIMSVCSVSVPIAVSTYIRSALLTLEHMLIPRALKKNGLSHSEALSSYGMLGSMVLPLVLYPASLTTSFASLLVPELAQSKERGDTAHISRTANKAITVTFLYAAVVAGIMISYSGPLGRVIYNSTEAGKYIRLLAPVIPIMYLDTVIDSMLKGLGYQVYTMIVNITDAAISVIGVIILISRFGILGYVVLITVSELINASASYYKLSEIVAVRLSFFRVIFLPIVFSILSCYAVRVFFSSVIYVSSESVFGLVLHIFSVILIYFTISYITLGMHRRPIIKYTEKKAFCD